MPSETKPVIEKKAISLPRSGMENYFNSFFNSISLSLKIAAYSNSSIFASAPHEAALRGDPIAISPAQAK